MAVLNTSQGNAWHLRTLFASVFCSKYEYTICNSPFVYVCLFVCFSFCFFTSKSHLSSGISLSSLSGKIKNTLELVSSWKQWFVMDLRKGPGVWLPPIYLKKTTPGARKFSGGGQGSGGLNFPYPVTFQYSRFPPLLWWLQQHSLQCYEKLYNLSLFPPLRTRLPLLSCFPESRRSSSPHRTKLWPCSPLIHMKV